MAHLHSARAFYLAPALAALVFCSASAAGRQSGASASSFYAAPTGTPGGNGSLASPWDLQTALNQPSAVEPGDTIWLRGGTYSGVFTSALTGTAASPVVVRQYPGERATLDGGSNDTATLTVNGAYTWFWGFEVMSSDPHRFSGQPGNWPTDIHRGDGIASGSVSSPGIKLINLTVHDTRQGISAFSTWSDSEIYGCLIYYSGWQAPDHANGHGIYMQNQVGSKSIVDNIVFQQFSHGLHAYTENGYLENITVEGSTFFNNGKLATIGTGRNLLLGGDVVAHNPSVLNNFMYYPNDSQPASAFYLGYTAGCSNAVVTGNYVANTTYMPNCKPSSMSGNAFYGNITGFATPQYPDNTRFAARPGGVAVFVRPNLYEPGRANITVFNWALQPTASVSLEGVLSVGDEFEIRNAQDFFGAAVLTGTYAGGDVTVPMTGLSTAAPVGWPTPPPTGPEFNVFVLQTTRPARQTPRSIDRSSSHRGESRTVERPERQNP